MDRPRIRVLIVEDSQVVRELLVHVLASDPAIEVVGTAADGAQALALLPRLKPDVVTMDINMPRMSGFDVTRRIMETQPLPVVIVSGSWSPDEVVTTFRAVEAGALAVVSKPHGVDHPLHHTDAAKLIETVKSMSEVKVVRRWRSPRLSAPAGAPQHHRPMTGPPPPDGAVQVIAIGALTGGPAVVQTILAHLPHEIPVPILIVQHIAAGFLRGLVQWLTATTRFPTRIASDLEVAKPGHAYLAPDGVHLGIARERAGPTMRLSNREPEGFGLRPSVNHLFKSVAASYGAESIGVILTGMGRDGVAGMKLMRQAGAATVAQDAESSVIYGMPGEAVREGAACHVMNPEAIAAFLVTNTTRAGKRT